MKPYGLDRKGTCNRTRRGTSRPCPCCTPKKQRVGGRGLKKRARQASLEDS
jgi:hypothetical protein